MPSSSLSSVTQLNMAEKAHKHRAGSHLKSWSLTSSGPQYHLSLETSLPLRSPHPCWWPCFWHWENRLNQKGTSIIFYINPHISIYIQQPPFLQVLSTPSFLCEAKHFTPSSLPILRTFSNSLSIFTSLLHLYFSTAQKLGMVFSLSKKKKKKRSFDPIFHPYTCHALAMLVIL